MSMKLDILNAISDKGLDLNEYDNEYELREALDYDGTLHEIIDGEIDIYYYDLRKWAVDNWQWVEDAVEEGIADTTDYHKMIQAGQYRFYEQQAGEIIEEIWQAHELAMEAEQAE